MPELPAAKIRARMEEIATLMHHYGYRDLATEIRYLMNAGRRATYLRKKNPYARRGWATPAVVRTVKGFLKAKTPHDVILRSVPEVPNIGRITDIKQGKYNYVLRGKKNVSTCPPVSPQQPQYQPAQRAE